MKAYNTRPSFSDTWCYSSLPYDYVKPGTNLDCLAEEWRCGNLTIQEASENLLAHIIEDRPRGRRSRSKEK